MTQPPPPCVLETVDANGEYSCFTREYDLWCPFATLAGVERYSCRSGTGTKAIQPGPAITHENILEQPITPHELKHILSFVRSGAEGGCQTCKDILHKINSLLEEQ